MKFKTIDITLDHCNTVHVKEIQMNWIYYIKWVEEDVIPNLEQLLQWKYGNKYKVKFVVEE